MIYLFLVGVNLLKVLVCMSRFSWLVRLSSLGVGGLWLVWMVLMLMFFSCCSWCFSIEIGMVVFRLLVLWCRYMFLSFMVWLFSVKLVLVLKWKLWILKGVVVWLMGLLLISMVWCSW